MLIANATGCSSIYGGNLPCTPYAVNQEGRGRRGRTRSSRTTPSLAWASAWRSTSRRNTRRNCCGGCPAQLGDVLLSGLLNNKQETEDEITAQRTRVAELNQRLTAIGDRDAKNLLASSDYLIRKSIWSFGGDGWAYDIGFGGMDYVSPRAAT